MVRRTQHVRLVVAPYATDRATVQSLTMTVAAWHALLRRTGLRRLTRGQASLALEARVDVRRDGSLVAWLAICCPAGTERQVEAALRTSYANVSVVPVSVSPAFHPAVIRVRRRLVGRAWVGPVGDADRPSIDRLLRAMAATGGASVVQVALRPSSQRWSAPPDDAASATRVQGDRERCAFAASVRVLGPSVDDCRAIAAVLLADCPELRIAAWPSTGLGSRRGRAAIERGAVRGPAALGFGRRWADAAIVGLWQLPSVTFAGVPVIRRATPVAPAPPGIMRVPPGRGLVRDDQGPVTIHPELRRQNTAVVGTVEQGKSSYLVSSIKEDLLRPDCSLIVLDPKGDAADAALSAVPVDRDCTFLDLGRPTCGFNPLAVDAPADAIADFVVAALRQLFAEGEVKGSSDRYLRNAVVAAVACDRRASLWDVARLLGVGEEARATRARAATLLVGQPQFAEVATFLADELPTQLADARAATTAKLDAPANKLARVLNSPSVKRVLLNQALRVDFDRLIDARGVLVVRGALGEIGPGNVAVLMQLLVGMLDAALARRQDSRADDARAIALKIDEAPLVINEAFAQTLALKRSAGLETVACWQADAQWPGELRERLDALFAHRVLFATASAQDARQAAGLLMPEFSDQLRAGDSAVSRLSSPETRLHLPRHAAIVSWTTPAGRERPFIGRTLPMDVDRARIAAHAAAQLARGGRELPADARPPDLPGLSPLGSESQSSATAMQLGDPSAQSRVVAGQSPAPPAADGPDESDEAPESYAELEALEGITRVRWLPVAVPRTLGGLDGADLELLIWIGAARCVLTSQAHRRFNSARALTTTQRRLKRLSDRGLIARFQLHGDNGGGRSLCCCATEAGLDLVGSRGRSAPRLDDDALPALREDVRTVGWLLALEAVAGPAVRTVLGPGRARISPPKAASAAPATLPLDPGLHARDFLTLDPLDGHRRPAEIFAAVHPDAVVEVCVAGDDRLAVDLLVVRATGRSPAVLAHYDHLLAGWWRMTPRYARLRRPPRVVVLCPGDASARALAALADEILVAAIARIGVAPGQWAYPGRAGVWFANEAMLHRGSLVAWQVRALPPAARGAAACSLTARPLFEPALDGLPDGRPTWR